MSKTTVKTCHGRKLILPSDKENAKIHAAAIEDRDAQPWTDEQLTAIKSDMRIGYGRTRINIRVDNRTLAAFKERAAKSGANYQTLMNEAMDEFIKGRALADVVRETIRNELKAA
jgi:predicted DNA binding CopG/RHH family protein